MIPVVKADGYGLGVTQVAPVLAEAGAHMLAVANALEALQLRDCGCACPILILSAVLPEDFEVLVEHDFTVTVSDPEEIEQLERLFRLAGKCLKVHLKIDTGMGRLGTWHTDVAPLLKQLEAAEFLKLRGIYTHFARAGVDPAFTEIQRQRFLEAIRPARLNQNEALLIHADNSAGLASLPAAHTAFNAARVGILNFGVSPTDQEPPEFDVEPVLSLRARITTIKQLPAGTPISYGSTHTLKRNSRIALLAAGYAEGIPLGLSNRGRVLIGGQYCPILGRVTMDQLIVDVSECASAAAGQVATLIGGDGDHLISVTEYARTGGTIAWQALCGLSKRTHRVYLT